VNVYNWKTGEFVLQQKHTTTPVGVGRLGFIGNTGLFVGLNSSFVNKFGLNEQLPQLDIWDLESGQITSTYDSLNACEVQDAGTYVKCSVYKVTSDYIGVVATRIFPVSDPNTILATDNEAKVFMVSSPTADGYATCEAGGNTISVKAGAAPALRLNYPCQPFVYASTGAALFLQDGTVVDIASGEAPLQLTVDDSGKAFEAGFIDSNVQFEPHLQLEAYIGQTPKFFEGDGFLVINNRVFDSNTGALLVELSGNNAVYGITVADEGYSLMLLTNRGLERWQVVQ
jgi:hypothetical protein